MLVAHLQLYSSRFSVCEFCSLNGILEANIKGNNNALMRTSVRRVILSSTILRKNRINAIIFVLLCQSDRCMSEGRGGNGREVEEERRGEEWVGRRRGERSIGAYRFMDVFFYLLFHLYFLEKGLPDWNGILITSYSKYIQLFHQQNINEGPWARI